MIISMYYSRSPNTVAKALQFGYLDEIQFSPNWLETDRPMTGGALACGAEMQLLSGFRLLCRLHEICV